MLGECVGAGPRLLVGVSQRLVEDFTRALSLAQTAQILVELLGETARLAALLIEVLHVGVKVKVAGAVGFAHALQEFFFRAREVFLKARGYRGHHGARIERGVEGGGVAVVMMVSRLFGGCGDGSGCFDGAGIRGASAAGELVEFVVGCFDVAKSGRVG